MNQIATGRAAPPAWPEAMGTYPPALSEIVLRALAPEPDERFQTMQELQIALESFARSSGVALSTVALASYLQELFADELAAWRAAQKEGKSLADHLAAKPVVVASADPAERTATDAFGSTAARARKSVRAMRTGALAGFFALCAVAGALATKHWHGRRGAERRRRARRKRSAVGGAGRGKESGNRTDRGKNSAVYDGDSSRCDEPVTHHDDHDHNDGDTKREDEGQGETGRDPPGAQRRRGPDLRSAANGRFAPGRMGSRLPRSAITATYRRLSRARGRLIAGDVRCLLLM